MNESLEIFNPFDSVLIELQLFKLGHDLQVLDLLNVIRIELKRLALRHAHSWSKPRYAEVSALPQGTSCNFSAGDLLERNVSSPSYPSLATALRNNCSILPTGPPYTRRLERYFDAVRRGQATALYDTTLSGLFHPPPRPPPNARRYHNPHELRFPRRALVPDGPALLLSRTELLSKQSCVPGIRGRCRLSQRRDPTDTEKQIAVYTRVGYAYPTSSSIRKAK